MSRSKIEKEKKRAIIFHKYLFFSFLFTCEAYIFSEWSKKKNEKKNKVNSTVTRFNLLE